MNIHLPNFKGEEKGTLYFIGNGFDLFHSLKTKFIHFYSWLNLKDNDHEQFAYDMECLFPASGLHGNWLWSDFEKALGGIDVDFIHDQYCGKENDVFNDKEYQERAARYLHMVTNKIPIHLREWLNESYHLCERCETLHLNPDSRYLSFNYTLLLEDVYKIPKDNVLHIHGHLNDQNPLTTGHLVYFPEKDEDPKNYNIERSLQNITQEANNLRKPVEKIIKHNILFFTLLSEIKNVVVFGHSLSPIDRPYFIEVVKNVQDNTRWFFVCKDDVAQYEYQQLVCRYYEKLKHNYGNRPLSKKLNPENCYYLHINKNQ